MSYLSFLVRSQYQKCAISLRSLPSLLPTTVTVSDQSGGYFPICRENVPRSQTYEFLPRGVGGCTSDSTGIQTAEECKTAALQLGGVLRDGNNPVIGTWGSVPCGCSIQAGSADVHFDTSFGDCSQVEGDGEGSYFPVCKKQEATGHIFLPTGGQGCPEDLHVTTVEGCRKAGRAYGGIFRDTANPVSDSSMNSPCGCSLNYSTNEIFFNTDFENCGQVGFMTPLCKAPPPTQSAIYFFEYSIVNQQFDELNDETSDVDTVSSGAAGLVANCASGSTSTPLVDLSFSISNSQSMTGTLLWLSDCPLSPPYRSHTTQFPRASLAKPRTQ